MWRLSQKCKLRQSRHNACVVRKQRAHLLPNACPNWTRHALSLQNENPTFCNTLQPMHSNLFSSSKLSKLYLAKIAIFFKFWQAIEIISCQNRDFFWRSSSGPRLPIPVFQSSPSNPPSPIPHPRSPKNYPLLIFPHLLINYLLNIAIDCGKFCIFARLN